MNNPISDSGFRRVLRSSDWGYDPELMQLSFRDFAVPVAQGGFIGFRIVRSRQ